MSVVESVAIAEVVQAVIEDLRAQGVMVEAEEARSAKDLLAVDGEPVGQRPRSVNVDLMAEAGPEFARALAEELAVGSRSDVIRAQDADVDTSLDERRTVSVDGKGRGRFSVFALTTGGQTASFTLSVSQNAADWIDVTGSVAAQVGSFSNTTELYFDDELGARHARLTSSDENAPGEDVTMGIQFLPG